MTTAHRSPAVRRYTARWACRLREAARLVGFWTAVALPMLLAGWLLVDGLRTGSDLTAFLVACLVEVVALVAGRGHA